jgi:hypothetical protein
MYAIVKFSWTYRLTQKFSFYLLLDCFNCVKLNRFISFNLEIKALVHEYLEWPCVIFVHFPTNVSQNSHTLQVIVQVLSGTALVLLPQPPCGFVLVVMAGGTKYGAVFSVMFFVRDLQISVTYFPWYESSYFIQKHTERDTLNSLAGLRNANYFFGTGKRRIEKYETFVVYCIRGRNSFAFVSVVESWMARLEGLCRWTWKTTVLSARKTSKRKQNTSLYQHFSDSFFVRLRHWTQCSLIAATNQLL